MNKIRKGDQVIVLTGRDKGRRGTVLSRVDEERLIVEGVNVVKKHVKPNPMKGITGGVIDKTLSIHQSNVAIFNRGDRQGRPRRHQALQRRRAESRKTVEQRRSRVPVERRRDQGLKRLSWLVCNEFYRDEGRPRPDQEVRLQLDDAGAAHHQDHAQHGRLGSGVRQEGDGPRGQRSDRRSPARSRSSPSRRRRSPASRSRDGVPIGCMVTLRGVQHVRVPRPLRDDRAAARARLPRHLARARSTAAATTTSASRNRSSSPSSSTTRSTCCAA